MSQSISLLFEKEGRPLAPALRTRGERVVAAILAANEAVSHARTVRLQNQKRAVRLPLMGCTDRALERFSASAESLK